MSVARASTVRIDIYSVYMITTILTGLGLLVFAFASIAWMLISVNGVSFMAAPGLLVRLRHYLGRNTAITSNSPALPELQTREFDSPPEELYDDLCLACRRLGWSVTRQSSEIFSLDAIAPNRLVGFEEQVSIILTAAAHGSGFQSRLNIRSVSRFGIADFGANVRRIIELSAEIDKMLEKSREVHAFDGNQATIASTHPAESPAVSQPGNLA